MSREIIYKLIDFFLAKESPYCKSNENRYEIGSKTSRPCFAPLLSTISKIARHCYTDKWEEKDTKKKRYPPDYLDGKVQIIN